VNVAATAALRIGALCERLGDIVEPFRLFRFCPKCGAAGEPTGRRQPFRCPVCGFHYYFNAAVAVAAILLAPDGRALFIRRAKEPAKGRLGLPGGFVDIGETAEDGLRREIKEEVDLEAGELAFVCSLPNEYLYRDVNYPVLDFFFIARVREIGRASARDGVESIAWRDPADVREDEMAFRSNWLALQLFLADGRSEPVP
jgi:ADP-ribose pyrophosphatase YjhB (NUDIX family)